MGHIRLTRGAHTIKFKYQQGGWRPGSAGITKTEFMNGVSPLAMGPLVLSDRVASKDFERIAPSNARALCGHRFDWLEAVGP